MTPRGRQLRRILRLREQMHGVAELDLRVAHGALRAAEDDLEQVRRASQAARDQQRTATLGGASEDWLMSCADAEFYRLGAAAYARRIAGAALAVDAAAERELCARRERRQMEVTLAALRREEACDAERAEQRQLDESSRLLSASSAAGLEVGPEAGLTIPSQTLGHHVHRFAM